jgi:ATP-binding cassette subfamily F protein uup
VVVSHDRYFLNRVCTGILAFEGEGRVVYSEGNYDYYLEKKKRALKPAYAPAPAVAPKATPPSSPAPKGPKARKLSFKEQKELEGLEKNIEDSEAEVFRLEAMLVSPDFLKTQGSRIKEVMAELEAAKKKSSTLFQRWEELEAIRAASEA